MVDFDELKNTAGEYLSEDDLCTLDDAYAFAFARHKMLLHSSGGSYISHLLDVANAGKPWGRVQLHQGGQECIGKDHFFVEIAPKRGTPIFDAS